MKQITVTIDDVAYHVRRRLDAGLVDAADELVRDVGVSIDGEPVSTAAEFIAAYYAESEG